MNKRPKCGQAKILGCNKELIGCVTFSTGQTTQFYTLFGIFSIFACRFSLKKINKKAFQNIWKTTVDNHGEGLIHDFPRLKKFPDFSRSATIWLRHCFLTACV